MDDLPPELQSFASLLDAQPGPVRDAFAYCLCLMMVEADKMRLVNTAPGDTAPICTFETVAGETFSIRQPPLSEEDEAALLEVLRGIMEEEDLL